LISDGKISVEKKGMFQVIKQKYIALASFLCVHINHFLKSFRNSFIMHFEILIFQSPAYHDARLQKGDVIMTLNSYPIEDMLHSDVYELKRSLLTGELTLKIHRPFKVKHPLKSECAQMDFSQSVIKKFSDITLIVQDEEIASSRMLLAGKMIFIFRTLP
jgi:hypothetical protein